MFRATLNRGFQLFFQNGYGISVQWGYSNYCENRSYSLSDFEPKDRKDVLDCKDAEVLVLRWKQNSPLNWESCSQEVFPDLFDGDEVRGWMDADEVADLIYKISQLNK